MNNAPLELVASHPGADAGISLFVKRDDLLHPDVQGNKWRKLAPVLAHVHRTHPAGIITFGGPFSNHLHAVAAAGRLFNIPTVGIVRGEHADLDNPTLRSARQNGMLLLPISKRRYDACKRGENLDVLCNYPDHFVLPEGGSTAEAVESCAAIAHEILNQLAQHVPPVDSNSPLFICVPAGTGCTAAGIVAGLEAGRGQALVFPVVNRGFDAQTILNLLHQSNLPGVSDPAALEQRFRIVYDYEFGGFAKRYPPVLDFVDIFRAQTGILLDPIYTAKMFFGVFDMLANGAFPPNSTVVAVHTGGLQGWEGFGRLSFPEILP